MPLESLNCDKVEMKTQQTFKQPIDKLLTARTALPMSLCFNWSSNTARLQDFAFIRHIQENITNNCVSWLLLRQK